MIKIRIATQEEQQAARDLRDARNRAKKAFDCIWKKEISAMRIGEYVPPSAKRLGLSHLDCWKHQRRHNAGEKAVREAAYIKSATRKQEAFYAEICRKADAAHQDECLKSQADFST
jgi:hypothetical protein